MGAKPASFSSCVCYWDILSGAWCWRRRSPFGNALYLVRVKLIAGGALQRGHIVADTAIWHSRRPHVVITTLIVCFDEMTRTILVGGAICSKWPCVKPLNRLSRTGVSVGVHGSPLLCSSLRCRAHRIKRASD